MGYCRWYLRPTIGPVFAGTHPGIGREKRTTASETAPEKLIAVFASTVDRILKATKKLQEKVRIGARVKNAMILPKHHSRKLWTPVC